MFHKISSEIISICRLFLEIKSSFPVTLALIIEASMESYFQFWLQINYNLPDIFTDIDTIEELVTRRTLSIISSFITITFSIIKIRFKKFCKAQFLVANSNSSNYCSPSLSLSVCHSVTLCDIIGQCGTVRIKHCCTISHEIFLQLKNISEIFFS